MLRTVEMPLMEFCAKQHQTFCAQNWLDSPLPAPELGTAALLLAFTRHSAPDFAIFSA